MPTPSTISKRHTHRRHISAPRLSPDITSTLPEYIPSPTWSLQQPLHLHNNDLARPRRKQIPRQEEEEEEDILPSDKPPDYPDSAEEADEDTDDSDTNILHVPQQHFPPLASFSPRAHTASPRHSKRFLTHKRGQSSQSHLLHSPKLYHHKPRQASERIPPPASADPFLDTLLERSVHALEMSNTLLQSSISTQTSLSAVLAGESPPRQTTLETHAANLSSRIRDGWDMRAAWADDLEEITKDVEGLFGMRSSATTPAGSVVDGGEIDGMHGRKMRLKTQRREGSGASGMSCSLPASTPLLFGSRNRSMRRPSLDLEEAAKEKGTIPGLHFARQSRDNLVSPPPRPITQFVPSSQDVDEIVLPSTIGVRSQSSMHHTHDPCRSVSELASSSTTSLLLAAPSFSTASSLPPKLTNKPLEPSTPAYNKLSSFVRQPASAGASTPSTSFTTSFMANLRRVANTSSNANSAGKKHSPSSSPSRLLTPRPSHSTLLHRPMTPPVEESSSSDSCMAKRTVQSLRKILDEQPPAPRLGLSGGKLKVPKFMPRTPAPVPEAGTSNATASISRLFTKGTHSSSTRAPSPKQSAMKHSRNNSGAPPTPTSEPHLTISASSKSPSPATLNIPNMVSMVLAGHKSASASSSGRSTPNKRISFAELPESYASTRPPGSSRFQEKHNRRKRKSATGKKGIANGSTTTTTTTDGSGPRWWLGAGTGFGFGGLGGLNMSLARQEERMEDRMTRGWAGRMNVGFASGFDEWAV